MILSRFPGGRDARRPSSATDDHRRRRPPRHVDRRRRASPRATRVQSGREINVSLSAAAAPNREVAYATADGSAARPPTTRTGSGTLTFAPGRRAGPSADGLVVGRHARRGGRDAATVTSRHSNTTIADGPSERDVDDHRRRPGPGNQRQVGARRRCRHDGDDVHGHAVGRQRRGGSGRLRHGARVDNMPGGLHRSLGQADIRPPGVASLPITVSVRGETVESNETFSVNLSNASAASIADRAAGRGTIVDDDPKPVITSFKTRGHCQGDIVTIRGMKPDRAGTSHSRGLAAEQLHERPGSRSSTTRGSSRCTSRPVPDRARVITTANGSGTGPVDLLIKPKVAWDLRLAPAQWAPP